MRSTIIYNKWDIILVPFPFTNLTATKRRPALIVFPNKYNEGVDVVIAFITSKLDLDRKIGDYKIQNWSQANLPKPSMIRMKFSTIDKKIIVKKLGVLDQKDVEQFRDSLITFFSN